MLSPVSKNESLSEEEIKEVEELIKHLPEIIKELQRQDNLEKEAVN